ncbi:MAG: amidase [Acidobacteria bacterium]|nr:amidase [Acidobacteriota bacterium]
MITRLAVGLLLLAASTSAPSAFTYVTDASGTWWGIQDAASPGVDTGSIRGTQIAPGQRGAFSTSINGFGGIRVLVQATPSPYMNGEVMRGFGLTFDGADTFKTTRAIDLGGVLISRTVYINRGANWGRWLDSFTNSTQAPLLIKVAFGGQSGLGASGGNSSAMVNTSSGDAQVTAADGWVEVATPLDGDEPVGGPQATVLGTPDTPDAAFDGAMTFAGHWLHDTFETPLSYSGHDGNFQAYVNTLTLPPGQSRSLLHFVVVGPRVTAASSAAARRAVESTAAALASAPDTRGLSAAEVCTIANFSARALKRGGACAGQQVVVQPPAPAPRPARTSARYDVVEKTIGALQKDMESGIVTSQEIARAYLDRIEYYDRGQFGFHSIEVLAADALAQAQAADAARKAGQRGPLLGIPIVVKNNYDTRDMATTNGSFTFENFRPARDAFQVARLRAAGAVLLGKAALEEYATSGHYSNDAFGQVWNAFNPSKSALGSSGGSATALAASLAAGALGSQTGDSLYAPASAQSLVTLRGTDGLESGTGIQPLTWLTDFGGAMARSVSDLADMLTVVAGTDPADPATAPADANIPKDWRTVLDIRALEGKRIGFIASAWVDPFGTSATIDAEKQALAFLEKAGATIVEMGATVGGLDAPPTPPGAPVGDIRSEGWMQYIESHPELEAQGFAIASAVDVNCSQRKVPYVRADPESCAEAPAPRLSPAGIRAFRDYRVRRQQALKEWMDTAGADRRGVDAVVYPGLLSDVSVNDGGGSRAAFGRRDTPSAAYGSPTVVVPAGMNAHGQPVDIQLLGRAWDDPKLVGFAYAFEHYATAAGKGHQIQTTARTLEYKP